MTMLKKMWWLFLLVAVALIYWKWSDVKGLFGKKEEAPKADDYANVENDELT